MKHFFKIILGFLLIVSCGGGGGDDPVTPPVVTPPVTPPVPPVTTYSLSVSAGTGGSVSSSGGTYNSGESVTITATADSGYVFTSWSDGSTNTSLTVTMDSDQTITASFELIVILEPGTPVLLSPVDDEPCQDGTSINDSQSEVNFQWQETENTENYTLTVTNLVDNSELSFNSDVNNKLVVLSKSEPYEWSVTAQGETGSTPTQSESWKFYLAGDAIVNYAPFPPELISPSSGANILALDNIVTLSWDGSDVDNDLSYYNLYFDDVDASTLVSGIDASTTSFDVSVSPNTLYYWRVTATDENGNSSDSGTYTFRVQ